MNRHLNDLKWIDENLQQITVMVKVLSRQSLFPISFKSQLKATIDQLKAKDPLLAYAFISIADDCNKVASIKGDIEGVETQLMMLQGQVKAIMDKLKEEDKNV